MASTSGEEQQQTVSEEVPEECRDQQDLQEQPERRQEQPEQQDELDGETLESQEEQSAVPRESEAPTLAPKEVATQVMAPVDADLLATQVMVPVDADSLATQVMAPVDADMLATQVMAAPTDADSLATQVMAPVEADLLATQVMRPVDPATQVTAQMDVDRQVEFQKPLAQKEVKKPKTAFRLFEAAVRNQVIEEVGTRKVNKLAAVIGAKWKSLDESEKAKYDEQAKVLRSQFDKEIADGAVPARSAKAKKTARAVAKKATAAAKRKAAKRKALESLKRRAGPKRPQCSYSIWLCDHRKQVRDELVANGNSEPSFEDIARAAGKTWTALTEEQKAPYLQRAHLLASKFKDISNACKEFRKVTNKVAKAKVAAAEKKASKVKKAAGKATKQAASKATKQAASKDKKPAVTKATKQSQPAADETAASSKTTETPRKKASNSLRPTPKKAKKAPAEQKAYLDMALMAEAEKLGFAGTLQKLAEREDMRPYPQRALLDALVASGGLLHRAKDAVFAGSVIQG